MEKQEDVMHKVPVIDIGRCTKCESCLEICPAIFIRNNETGLIEVAELPEYPEDGVQEGISMCPTDCITWEEVQG
jgi:ferredoxin